MTDHPQNPRTQAGRDVEASGSEARDETLRVPLVEEQLDAQVVETERGTVRIHKRVESVPVSEDVTLHHQVVDVERVAHNEYVNERRPPWYEGDVLMIPVYEEVPVVETRLVLREIVQVRQAETTETVRIEDEARREVVDVERTGET